MTTTVIQRPGKIVALRAEYETAVAATREADRVCNVAQPDHDELTEQLKALRAERRRAPDDGATAAQLRAQDSRIAETERRLEVSAAELRRRARARDEAAAAARDAVKHLDAAIRRRERLPDAIREVRTYLVVRGRELRDAELIVSQVRATITEHETMLARLTADLVELEGRAE